MYLDFEDYHPEIERLVPAISWREGILLSIIVHLAMIILMLAMPKLPWADTTAARARLAAIQRQHEREAPRFVFVRPSLDLDARKPPERGEDSDKDRQAQSPETPPNPANPLPFARGNSSERVEADRSAIARGQAQTPEPPRGSNGESQPATSNPMTLPNTAEAPQVARDNTPGGGSGQSIFSGSALGEALRNLQRYVQAESFDNPQGGSGAFGPSIQFDTKGVEFGPWLRRFVAQIKRNWFIPYAAMAMKGHVAITFYVYKDGTISDLAVVGPSGIDAFNNAAYNALASSNPTQPLPPEYPADRAFFTVTFYYNETPPMQ